MTLIEFLKKPTNRIIAAALVSCASILIGYNFLNNRKICMKDIKEFDEITYQQGAFSFEDKKSLNKNVMIARKGNKRYILEDIFNETNISLKKDTDFKKDILERVVEITGDERKVITDANELKKYSKMYNELREGIIKRLRKRYKPSFGGRSA
ncbi:MAG: hypothetical protein PVJ67_01585 [Candidatus Pacearchaeota archaeon]|jgi:hypothetical protein